MAPDPPVDDAVVPAVVPMFVATVGAASVAEALRTPPIYASLRERMLRAAPRR